MNQVHILTAPILVSGFLCLLCPSADAQEIYKWTDSNGRVHYGDRAGAPENSTKMNVAVVPPRPPSIEPEPVAGSQHSPALQSRLDPAKKSVPVDTAVVAPACKGLIEKIAAVPVGQNWESLSRQFDNTCPGIAYECVEYKSRPQNNQCTWIQRSGNSIMNTKKYP